MMSGSPIYRGAADYEIYKNQQQQKKVMLYQQAPPRYGSSESLNIVHEILCDQDLSRAGNLFTLGYDILLKDFPTTLRILKNMIDNRKYINNLNEQSIVEIVLTKCIAALRFAKLNLFYRFHFFNSITLLKRNKDDR